MSKGANEYWRRATISHITSAKARHSVSCARTTASPSAPAQLGASAHDSREPRWSCGCRTAATLFNLRPSWLDLRHYRHHTRHTGSDVPRTPRSGDACAPQAAQARGSMHADDPRVSGSPGWGGTGARTWHPNHLLRNATTDRSVRRAPIRVRTRLNSRCYWAPDYT